MNRMPSKCRICGNDRLKKVTGRAGWEVYACETCTNAFTYPSPLTDRQYEENTFFALSGDQMQRWRKHAAEVVQFISAAGCHGTFLDVGFGSGLVIEAALAAGFQAQGIEASQPAVVAAQRRGLDVQEGYLKENTFAADTFDVIVMSHVLEHVADPRNLLAAAVNQLKRGGCLFLSQTNYQGTLPRLLGARWYAWVPAQHFIHFSPKGMTYLLQSSGLGLEVKTVQLTTLFWDHVDLFQTPLRLWPGTLLHNTAVLVNQARLAFPFVGDNMYVLAQKV